MSRGASPRRLRVGLVAGTLAQGGAEKQLVYLASALRQMDADVALFSLTRGEHFDSSLREIGIEPTWIGRRSDPASRTLALIAALRATRPHIVQSTHFYTNLYARLAAPAYGAMDIGTARSDVVHEVAANGRWGRWLLRSPNTLIVNSQAAKANAIAYGVVADAVHVLPNVIDLALFDAQSAAGSEDLVVRKGGGEAVLVAGVGSFVRAKRFDRFLHSIAIARSRGAPVHGLLAGDGPECAELRLLAAQLDLLPDGVTFLGRRHDVPTLLRSAGVFLLSSDHEGFPNVLLEAMAAGLPAIATPAGDAPVIVEQGSTGFVVQPDAGAIADKLVTLARSESLRRQLGAAARRRVELGYDVSGLANRLSATYRAIATIRGHRRVVAALR